MIECVTARPSLKVAIQRLFNEDGNAERLQLDPEHVSAVQRWCRRGDLNPYALAGTSPSSWRVCLFRHSDATPNVPPPGGKH